MVHVVFHRVSATEFGLCFWLTSLVLCYMQKLMFSSDLQVTAILNFSDKTYVNYLGIYIYKVTVYSYIS